VALVIFLSLVVVVLTAAHLVLVPRSLRQLRALKEEGRAFREHWRALEPARRREISRAIRRGRPVADPQEVEVALENIRNAERVVETLRPLQLVYSPAIAGLFVFGLVEGDRFLIFSGAAIVVLAASISLFQWQRARKLRAAAAAMEARY
jgi:hypothetical protein